MNNVNEILQTPKTWENINELLVFVTLYFIAFRIGGTFIDTSMKQLQQFLISRGWNKKMINFILSILQLTALIMFSYYVRKFLYEQTLNLVSTDSTLFYQGASALIFTQIFTTQANLQDMMKNTFF